MAVEFKVVTPVSTGTSPGANNNDRASQQCYIPFRELTVICTIFGFMTDHGGGAHVYKTGFHCFNTHSKCPCVNVDILPSFIVISLSINSCFGNVYASFVKYILL